MADESTLLPGLSLPTSNLKIYSVYDGLQLLRLAFPAWGPLSPHDFLDTYNNQAWWPMGLCQLVIQLGFVLHHIQLSAASPAGLSSMGLFIYI